MEYNLENRISMYYKIREFYSNNLLALAVDAPVITAQAGTFNTELTALEALVMTTETDLTGYAVQKLVCRTAMRNQALTISGATHAYAIVTGNHAMQAKVYTTKSTLDKKRDAEVLLWCEKLRELVAPIALPIEPYGITAQALTDYATAILNYRNVIQDPADKRGESKAALQAAYAQCDTVDTSLKILDGIMLALSIAQPLLYNQYLADRLIDDNAGGIGSPDVTEIIEAGNTESIYNISYLASRTFKLKNTGTHSLQWGLSDNAATPSNAMHTIDAGATSTKQSDTLAPNGDYLLVKNGNPADITIELTVID